MDIPNPEPFTVAAKQEQVFDKLFCTRLHISAKPNEPWIATFTGVPYDGDSVDDKEWIMRLEDLKTLSALDHELAQAMGAVLAVVGKYLVKGKINKTQVVNAENIAEVLK